jgi:hypothetical protein
MSVIKAEVGGQGVPPPSPAIGQALAFSYIIYENYVLPFRLISLNLLWIDLMIHLWPTEFLDPRLPPVLVPKKA